MPIDFKAAADCAMAPKSFKEMASDMLADLAAQAASKSIWEASEGLRHACMPAPRRLRAKMRLRPGLIHRRCLRPAERAARHFEAAETYGGVVATLRVQR